VKFQNGDIVRSESGVTLLILGPSEKFPIMFYKYQFLNSNDLKIHDNGNKFNIERLFVKLNKLEQVLK
jgi:hypothetical protein